MGGKGSGRRKGRTKVEHGAVQGYSRGCRCTRCRTAWAAYMRQRRAAQPKRQKPSYYQRSASERSIRLSELGEEILTAVASREQRAPGDVVEHLLRLHAAELRFDESVAAA